VEVDAAVLDAAVVERILDNLLSNAVNHTPAATPVEVAVGAEPGGVLLSVVDHGPGVPPLLRQAIFQPFGVATAGLDDSGRRGVGVGLHLVARFAELHGGRAWVEPTPSGGATFRVLLRENP
jgi:two-component system OmpR family sensor kinase